MAEALARKADKAAVEALDSDVRSIAGALAHKADAAGLQQLQQMLETSVSATSEELQSLRWASQLLQRPGPRAAAARLDARAVQAAARNDVGLQPVGQGCHTHKQWSRWRGREARKQPHSCGVCGCGPWN
jgi:hypothetical protein